MASVRLKRRLKGCNSSILVANGSVTVQVPPKLSLARMFEEYPWAFNSDVPYWKRPSPPPSALESVKERVLTLGSVIQGSAKKPLSKQEKMLGRGSCLISAVELVWAQILHYQAEGRWLFEGKFIRTRTHESKFFESESYLKSNLCIGAFEDYGLDVTVFPEKLSGEHLYVVPAYRG